MKRVESDSLVKGAFAVMALVAVATVCWRYGTRDIEKPVAAPGDLPLQPLASAPLGAIALKTQHELTTDWRAELAKLGNSEAVIWLNDKLDGGEDAPTGEGFVPGRNGRLQQTPTWRVAWLEALGQRDAGAAAKQAEKMLTAPTSPEEWAAALRWLALGNPQARSLLKEKTRALLKHEQWRSNPTAAWLEAFDVAVYLGGTSLLPELAELSRDLPNRPASHAAFLALDRLAQKDPGPVLTALQADAGLLTARESMRANLFARADVGDAAQRQVLEAYLLAPNQTAGELEAFADVFPNANYHISANLLTVSRVPDAKAQRVRDRNSLAVTRSWRKDSRFGGIDQHLARLERRLEDFVGAR